MRTATLTHSFPLNNVFTNMHYKNEITNVSDLHSWRRQADSVAPSPGFSYGTDKVERALKVLFFCLSVLFFSVGAPPWKIFC